MMEDDEYEHDSVYENQAPCSNDINIKSECVEYEEEFDDQYYDDTESESSNIYTFRRDETMTMDVVLADNNSAHCIQTNHSDDIAIPAVINFIISIIFWIYT